MSVYKKLETLFSQYQNQAKQKTDQLPVVAHDAQWPSPCEVTDTLENGQIQWQAVEKEPKTDMENLSRALEVKFPQELGEFYGSFYADNITVSSPWGQLVLLQAWSEDDYDQLQQNITGHVLMKQKLKHDETVFIALTQEDDLLVTVENCTGYVWLEYVGKRPHQKISDSVSEFLEHLKADFIA
ncbi:SecY-interacting protein [Pseudoalteromonas sp. C2R02]|uniref:SecY-interacting protein n=1 Tax=Pseudoalteromonas sp. C2R02 TaxID=2841565 RepID=UPI001C081DC5|nr:SecY-interacting protein [Pseudoalteromonas sp. C2R02]MBU2971018.1 SecY-interacting protein [Pseudoalteromonas sp. C2R02]